MNEEKTILDFDKDDGIEISKLIEIFKSQKELFISLVSLITILSIIYSLLLTPIYQAEVLAIPAEQPTTASRSLASSSFSGIASLAGINLSADGFDYVRTLIAIAESKKFNILFVKQEDLLPIFFKEDWDQENKRWKNDEIPSDLAALSQLRDYYSINYDMRDGLITITMNWDDPELAALYANKFVKSLNNYIRDDEIAEAQESINYLKKEIENTDLLDIRNVLNLLIQDQLQTIMLANVRED